jgi:hypothetical protein
MDQRIIVAGVIAAALALASLIEMDEWPLALAAAVRNC